MDVEDYKNHFLKRFHELYGNKYTFDWEKTPYKNQSTKITAICSLHGEFSIIPYSLLIGRGCHVCDFGKHLRPNGYWNNREHCKEAVLDSKGKFDLQKRYQGAYNAIERNGWQDLYELIDCKQMFHSFDEPIHCVYVYKIIEYNTCYVGRTLRMKVRDRQHRNGVNHQDGSKTYDNLHKFCQEHNIEIPQYEILENGLNAPQSQEREAYWVNKFKEDGWNLINKGKVGIGVGSLGSSNKWNYETCKEEAKKYSSRYDFRKNCQPAYHVCLVNRWIDEFIPIKLKKDDGYWDKLENCQEAASKYRTFKEVVKNCGGCYNSIRKHGWQHLIQLKKD